MQLKSFSKKVMIKVYRVIRYKDNFNIEEVLKFKVLKFSPYNF